MGHSFDKSANQVVFIGLYWLNNLKNHNINDIVEMYNKCQELLKFGFLSWLSGCCHGSPGGLKVVPSYAALKPRTLDFCLVASGKEFHLLGTL